jgi:hypothetical protein
VSISKKGKTITGWMQTSKCSKTMEKLSDSYNLMDCTCYLSPQQIFTGTVPNTAALFIIAVNCCDQASCSIENTWPPLLRVNQESQLSMGHSPAVTMDKKLKPDNYSSSWTASSDKMLNKVTWDLHFGHVNFLNYDGKHYNLTSASYTSLINI